MLPFDDGVYTSEIAKLGADLMRDSELTERPGKGFTPWKERRRRGRYRQDLVGGSDVELPEAQCLLLV